MDITLEPAARRMRVAGTVRLPAAPLARDSVRLLLWSKVRDVRFELMQPAGPATVSTDTAEGDRSWYLRSARTIPAGAPVVIAFSYRADSADAPQLRITPEGSLAGSNGELWYPRQGFDSLATGTLRFLVPSGETVVAPGTQLEAESITRAGQWAFRIEQPSLFGFAAGRYQVTRWPAPTPVALYLLTPRPDAAAIAERAARTLAALTDLFGAPPRRGYGVVEVEFGGSVAGTSEPGFFLADRSKLDEGFTLPFFGHEMGHAWWGGLVRSRPGTVGRMMLSEGLAQYGMLEVLQRIEGPEAAARFRRGEYQGYQLAGATGEYFRLAAAGLELPLTAFEPRGAQVLTLHRMANTRGFLLIAMLGDLIGRERFHDMLRRFTAAHTARPASWTEFEAAASAATGRDMGWFFDEWLDRAGAPEYQLVLHQAGRTVRGEVRQGDTTYGAVLELAFLGGGRSVTRSLAVRGRVTPFSFTLPFAADSAVLDPHYRVLRWTPDNRASAFALAAFTRADWTRRYGDRRQAVEQFRAALDAAAGPDRFGREFLLRLGLARALAAGGDARAARSQLDSALTLPHRSPEQLPLAYRELAAAALALGDSVTARRATQAAREAERAMTGSQR